MCWVDGVAQGLSVLGCWEVNTFCPRAGMGVGEARIGREQRTSVAYREAGSLMEAGCQGSQSSAEVLGHLPYLRDSGGDHRCWSKVLSAFPSILGPDCNFAGWSLAFVTVSRLVCGVSLFYLGTNNELVWAGHSGSRYLKLGRNGGMGRSWEDFLTWGSISLDQWVVQTGIISFMLPDRSCREGAVWEKTSPALSQVAGDPCCILSPHLITWAPGQSLQKWFPVQMATQNLALEERMVFLHLVLYYVAQA